jgi:hypothetical protein
MNRFKLATLALFVGACALTQACDAAQMALKLEGDVASYFAVPDNPSLDKDLGSNFTIEAWINPAVTVEENNGVEMMILNKEDSYEMADVADTFQVAIRPADVGDNAGAWEYWDSGIQIPKNTWTHVAATWDGTTIRTFVNGKFAQSFEKLGPDGEKGILSFENGASAGKATLKVGRRGRGDDLHSIFNGLIDEIRISKVLRYTEAGYTVPAKAFEPDADTVALYHFDEASTDAADVQALRDKFSAQGQTDDNGDGELDALTSVLAVVKDASPAANHGGLTGGKATLVAVSNGPFKDQP